MGNALRGAPDARTLHGGRRVGQHLDNETCSSIDAAWAAGRVTESLETFDRAVQHAMVQDLEYLSLFSIDLHMHRFLLASYTRLRDEHGGEGHGLRLRFPNVASPLARWVALCLLHFWLFSCTPARSGLTHDDVSMLSSPLSAYCSPSILYLDEEVRRSFQMVADGALADVALRTRDNQVREYFSNARRTLSDWLHSANPFPLLITHTVRRMRDMTLDTAFGKYFGTVLRLLDTAAMPLEHFTYRELDYSRLSSDQRGMAARVVPFGSIRRLLPSIRSNCTRAYLFDLLLGTFVLPEAIMSAARKPQVVTFMADHGHAITEAVAALGDALEAQRLSGLPNFFYFVCEKAEAKIGFLKTTIRAISRMPRGGYDGYV
jgi:hypothetical protein